MAQRNQPVYAHHQGQAQGFRPMAQAGKTKKLQMETKKYNNIGLTLVARKFWWSFLLPFLWMVPAVFDADYTIWMIVLSVVTLGIYALLWYAQFYAISQMPGGQALFEKMSYEIGNEYILARKNTKEGMPISWDDILRVEKVQNCYVFFIFQKAAYQEVSKIRKMIAQNLQFIYIPIEGFNSEADQKLAEAVLKRKNLLPA